MNSLEKGSLGMARAIYEYRKLGYNVAIPLVDAQSYDLVIEKDNKFYSVQCKMTNQKSPHSKEYEAYIVGLRSIKANTNKTIVKHRGIYDILFVLCGNNDVYSIPTSLIKAKSAIVVGRHNFSECKL